MMKKLSLLLVAVLVVASMGLTTFAANDQKIDHIDRLALGDYIGRAATSPEETRPGDEIIIPLLYDGFRNSSDSLIDWGAETKGGDPLGPNLAQLNNSKIKPVIQVAKGSKYIRDVSFVKYTPTERNRARAAIRIRFVDDLVSTEEFEYQFQLLMQVHGSGQMVTLETFGGRISNIPFEAYKNDFIDISDGTVVKAAHGLTNLELGLGSGVSVFIDASTDQKYYGKASHLDNRSDIISKDYPEIIDVYEIKSINLKASTIYVTFDGFNVNNALYVYDIRGKFVGMSHEKLAYSERYYLSNADIDIDPAVVDELFDARPIVDKDDYMSAALRSFTEGVSEAQKVKEPPTTAPTEY